MADPGFPVGDVGLVGVDSQGSYISKILYVKTKEFGPLGGACARHAPLDPPMLVAEYILLKNKVAKRQILKSKRNGQC